MFSALLFAASLVAALIFSSAFEDGTPPFAAPILCGDPAPLDAEQANASDTHADHDANTQAKQPPRYFAGGLWAPEHGLSPMLDAAMLALSDERPIVCQSAIASGESLAIIDCSPIRLSPSSGDAKPDLVLSIDYAGSISSMAYPAAAALQKYITDVKDNYNAILVVEPLPGPVRDPDEDWTYLNFDGDEKIDFFTPKRNNSPAQIAQRLYRELGGSASVDAGISALIEQLAADDRNKAAAARLQLIKQSPYRVVPALRDWVADSEGAERERRVYESLMIRRGMGVHADALIAEAAGSENVQLRALAARAIGDLAEVTTDPIGKLTPLAEDDAMTVRYEALVATRAMPGRRAAGVAELVEPYEMTDAMRAVYQGTMAKLLTYGEPVAADSKANRLRRMAINDLLKEDRSALVCTILLERADLPDDKIDEVLGQLAKANGNGPLVALLNLLETMNPRTLEKREVLLERLVNWPTNELDAQADRLQELALRFVPDNLRSAAAAALLHADGNKAVQLIGVRPILFKALDWDKTPKLATFLTPVILQTALSLTEPQTATRVAALDVFIKVPADAFTNDHVKTLLGLAREETHIGLRFAAIRAVNALPDSVKPDKIDDLKLTTLDIAAVPGQMKYDKQTLTVTAGRPVELTLTNPDTMEHNLVITLPGRAQEIGIAMSADPTAAAAIGYVPQDNDAVLHHTKMIPAGGFDTLRFIAPTKPDSYEYVCTFPGHYTSMRGVLEVVAP